MPMPETDSLATFGQLFTPAAVEPLRPRGGHARCVRSRSACGTVKLMFACPSRPKLCTIMSTKTPAFGDLVEHLAAMPGRSGTSMIVTRACDSSSDISSIVSSSIPCSRRTISISVDRDEPFALRHEAPFDARRLLGQLERGMDGPQRRLRLDRGRRAPRS